MSLNLFGFRFIIHRLFYGLNDTIFDDLQSFLICNIYVRLGDSMLIGYMRVSKTDGSQSLDLQVDALMESGVVPENMYQDFSSGKNDVRQGLDSCLKALRKGDTLVVWKLDRLGRNLKHLVNTVHDLSSKGIGFNVLTGQGANIDTSTPQGKLVFGIFAALAEFERDLISERTKAGLDAARARGRNGGAPYKMTAMKLQLAQTAMEKSETNVMNYAENWELHGKPFIAIFHQMVN